MIESPITDLISKDLRRWFKEKWVDVSRKDKDGKHPPCGRSDAKTSSKGYPKCRPSKKVSDKTPKTTKNMSAKEKKAATKRKRSKPQGVGGKPTMVKSVTAFDKAWTIVKDDEDEEPCISCGKMVDKDDGIYMGRTFDSQKGPFCSMDCWSGSKYFFDRHDPPHDWER